jgi:hypothetical protein
MNNELRDAAKVRADEIKETEKEEFNERVSTSQGALAEIAKALYNISSTLDRMDTKLGK